MAIVSQFMAEKLRERRDIIAVLISGSAARGDAHPMSDVDLRFVCDVPMHRRMDRQDFDEWRDGIYLDSGPVPRELYLDAGRLLVNLRDGSCVYDSQVLHDPTGQMTAVRQRVRDEYCKPGWVLKRVHPLIAAAGAAIRNLETVDPAGDLIEICRIASSAISSAATARIAAACVSPSSSRTLERLSGLSPSLARRIEEAEGITRLSQAEVRSLHGDIWKDSPRDLGRLGRLAEYWAKKTRWMIDNGLWSEAAHWFWGEALVSVDRIGFSSPEAKVAALQLRRDWLSRMGWNPSGLDQKVRDIREIIEKVERSAEAVRGTAGSPARHEPPGPPSAAHGCLGS